ncbi:MAG TPA: UDP-glucose 4-epimerase GalE, partial [Rhodospirillales bacterium]
MPNKRVLITGAAGYIGSHMLRAFAKAGRRVTAVDDLSTGTRALVPGDVPFVEASVADVAAMRRLLKEHGITGVIHLAASIVVPESVEKPLAYYDNNTSASRNLLEACVEAGVESFVFSSTAAVYGAPDELPVSEDAPLVPISPYARSKLMTEWMLEDTAKASGLRYAILRYFNVAGADPGGETGQVCRNAMHLIKVAVETAVGLRTGMQIYGTDYDTPDGTCIRDYIHVGDLAEAHVAALAYLEDGGANLVANCGYGHGHSVREVLAAVERVSGRSLPVTEGPRRPGDAPALVAATGRIREAL